MTNATPCAPLLIEKCPIRDGLLIFMLMGLFCLTSPELLSQQTYFGQVFHKGKPLAQVEMRWPGNLGSLTDNEGFFEMQLPTGTRVVTLGLEHPDLLILSPVDGQMSLSSDRSLPTPIYVGTSEERAVIYQLIGRFEAEGANRMEPADIDRLWQGYFKTGKDMLKQAESYRNEGGQQLAEARTKLQQAEAKLAEIEGVLASMEIIQAQSNASFQQQVYERFTRYTNTFTDRLLDVHDLLKLRSKRLLDNDEVAAELNQKLIAYSEARDSLNANRKAFVAGVSTYWEKQSLSREVEDLVELAIDDIHQGLMLPFNDKLLIDINNYIQQQPRHRKRSAILNDIETLVANLHRKIQVLDRNKEMVYQSLQN